MRHSLSINPLFKRVEPAGASCGSKRKATAGLWTMRANSDAPKPAATKRKADDWIEPHAKAHAPDKLCAVDDHDVAEMLMALASGSYGAELGVSVR